MSYNGSGTFNINTAGQPVVTGTTITSTAFNLLTADLATGLSTALTKDGQSTPTANIPMGAFKITGLGAGTAATDAAQYGQLQAGATTIATVTGTDTYVGTLTPAIAAYATGNLFSFVAPNTNTGAATINLNSLGAKNITKLGSTALAAGDIVSGRVYQIEYDGTRFQLLNPSASSVSSFSAGSTGFTPSSATTGAVTLAGTLATTNGGTGLTSFTANGLVYASSSSALATGSNLTYDGTNFGLNGGFLQVSIGGTQAIRVGSTDSIVGGTSNNGILQVGSSKALLFYAGGSEYARFDTSGNLGIGTSSPTQKLHVQGYIYANSGYTLLSQASGGGSIYEASNNTGINIGTTSNTLQFITGATTRATIDSSGNLGLGVTPSAWNTGWTASQIGSAGSIAAIKSTTGPSLTFSNNAYLTTGGAWNYITSSPTNPATQYEQYNGNHKWYNAASGTGAITWTQAMTLDASGNLLVGTTSGSDRLTVNGTSASFSSPSGSCTVGIAGQNASGANAVLNFTCPGSNSATAQYVRSSSQFQVINGGSGGVYLASGGVAWLAVSDERKKENLVPITDAVAKVSSLRAVTGNYIADTDKKSKAFLIAQDVQAVLPEAVDNSDPDVMGLAYTDVIPLLVAAIKELKSKFDAYKASHP